jgi:hypothetical protein
MLINGKDTEVSKAFDNILDELAKNGKIKVIGDDATKTQ